MKSWARAEPMDPKIVHNYRWLHEWAHVAGLPLVFPTAHHPVKSVLAMRSCCALEQNQPALHQFSKAAFDAYFARGENIDEPDVIRAIADACGLDGASLVSCTGEQPIKDHLRSNTEEAIERGAYGSPTMFIDDVLYTGRTIRAALTAIESFGRPKTIELLILVDRRFSRELPIQPDYKGVQVDVYENQKVNVKWNDNKHGNYVYIENMMNGKS